MERPFAFAVVGYGFIGRRHCELVRARADARLAAVADPDPERAALAAAEQNVPAFATLEELLEKHPEVEVVSIATPNNLHAPLAIQALEARRHVVIEKPMGLHKAECEEVIHKALQVSRHVFCVMQNRYSPPVVWLKDLMRSGALGRMVLVEINCFWNRDHRYYKPGGWKGTLAQDGGTLYTQFSHFIDIMYWLLGDIEHIRATVTNQTHQGRIEIEDTGQAFFRFRNGGLCSLNFTTSVWDTNQESSLTLIGEKGSVKVGGQYMDRIDYCHIEGVAPPELLATPPPNDYGGYKGSAANHPFIFQNVVDTLCGVCGPATNALEGMKVVDIIERIYLAAERV